MRVFMIGGTGLLGSEAARVLLQRGHEVVSLALPPLPAGANLPEGMQLRLGDYTAMSDEELSALMRGCDGFVFAAGVDERVEHAPPIYDFFVKHNNEPLKRLLRLARESGIRRVVICGSYFCHFAKLWPEKQLDRWHPYIRSRLEQEEIAFSFAGPEFDVSVLELPYIFGAQPGRKPVWVFLVKIIRGMPLATFYPTGGTAMVTARQTGEAMAGALEHSRGAKAWPIGWFNLTWKEMFAIMHRHMGMPGRKVITVPRWMFALSAWFIKRGQQKRNIEGGLDLVRYSEMMASELFIDKSLGSAPLGVTGDDIEAAIASSVRQSMKALAGEEKMVDMKGEATPGS